MLSGIPGSTYTYLGIFIIWFSIIGLVLGLHQIVGKKMPLQVVGIKEGLRLLIVFIDGNYLEICHYKKPVMDKTWNWLKPKTGWMDESLGWCSLHKLLLIARGKKRSQQFQDGPWNSTYLYINCKSPNKKGRCLFSHFYEELTANVYP